MNIAILLADIAVYGHSGPNDADKFQELLQPFRPEWRFEIFPVRDGVFPKIIGEHDGYLITGSAASVHETRPWIPVLMDFIREIDRRKLPLIGTCFGHQAIVTALNGRVGRNPQGWNIGVTETCFTNFMPWMFPTHPRLRLYSVHNEQVLEMPPRACVVGHDSITPCSSLAIESHIFTTQHHPEITPDYMVEILEELTREVDSELLSAARHFCARGAQGNLFAQWMVQFFEKSEICITGC